MQGINKKPRRKKQKKGLIKAKPLLSPEIKNIIEEDRKALADVFLEVDGIKITLKMFKVFESYCDHGGDIKEVCQEMGITPDTVYKWRKTTWWAELQRLYIQPWQEKLFSDMAIREGMMIDAFEKVLKGEFPDPKQAMAAFQMIKLFSTMGIRRGDTKTEPLVHSVRDMWVDPLEHQEVDVNINYKIVMEVAKEMTQEEAMDWARTQVLPERLQDKVDLLSKQSKDIEITDVEVIKEEENAIHNNKEDREKAI